MMNVVTVSNIGKAYKQYPSKWSRLIELVFGERLNGHKLNWVLKNINFEVAPGQSLGIMGVNGAGKSTLLKILTGTTTATTGNVLVRGRVAALLELGMGFHPDFTGRQNVYMSANLLGFNDSQIDELMPQIEAFAEIGDYIDQPVRTYSSGMQVRLAFSVATMHRPDLLIIDEALAVGDAYFQAKCYERIADFKKRGTSLLLVSHSVGDIVKHCDRAILIKNGEIVCNASAREVSNKYLDEIFGKKKDTSSSNVESKSLDMQEILKGEEDLYHTRLGYRKEEYRWGQGGAKILDFKILVGSEEYPNMIQSGSNLDFFIKVKFNNSYDSVVPGLLIKTHDGVFIYGTNSFISSNIKNYISVDTGDIRLFKFSLPVNLNAGHYLLSVGISQGDPLGELIPLDRRYDSLLINVERNDAFWGIADLKATFNTVETD